MSETSYCVVGLRGAVLGRQGPLPAPLTATVLNQLSPVDRMIKTKDLWVKRADLTLSKILFYILFWGAHVAVFAAGWFVMTSLQAGAIVLTLG